MSTATLASKLFPQSARYADPTADHLPSGHRAGGKRPPLQYQFSGHYSRLWRSEQKKPFGVKQGMGDGVDML